MKGLVLLALLVASTALLAEGQNINVVITTNSDGIGIGGIRVGGGLYAGVRTGTGFGGNIATRSPGGLIPGAIDLVGRGLSSGINLVGNVLSAKTNFEGRTINTGGILGGNLAQTAGSLVGNAAAGVGNVVGNILGGIPRVGGSVGLNAGAGVAFNSGYQRPVFG
uniref:Uncharacterized protein n=1 Tax=Anopheles culicifacies TaxID=139723 RepID=A0A182M6T5_9DIPT